MKNPEINDNSREYKEVLTIQDKEKIWSDTFGSEYKPDFDYKDFFYNIKSQCYDSGYGLVSHEVKDDIEKFAELFPIIEKKLIQNGH